MVSESNATSAHLYSDVNSGTNIGTSTNIHPNNAEQFDIFDIVSVDGDDVVSSAEVRPRVKAAQTDVFVPALLLRRSRMADFGR